jgi:hypothetical protein
MEIQACEKIGKNGDEGENEMGKSEERRVYKNQLAIKMGSPFTSVLLLGSL